MTFPFTGERIVPFSVVIIGSACGATGVGVDVVACVSVSTSFSCQNKNVSTKDVPPATRSRIVYVSGFEAMR